MILTRRELMAGLAALGLSGRAGAGEIPLSEGQPFGADTVRDLARRLAQDPFRPVPPVPAAWTDMDYDAYRTLWFRSSDALFSDTDAPLRVDLLHPGAYYNVPVRIDVVEDGTARQILFDLDLFDRTDRAPELPVDETVGYSGMRLRSEFERPDIFQEFMVFQGASYFRAIAKGLTYGLSARGLAIGTGSPEGEEFPLITRLWIERPSSGATTFRVHALLDSPSTAGALRFDITPGEATEIAVDASFFPRVELENVGIAPLTSMFLFDETNRGRFDDYRSAVHDNDGLAIHNGAGEALWRSLANPKTLQISSFFDEGPKGFGLMQRARSVSDFGDLEAHYEDRPGLWIAPQGEWGEGSVVLVEIPTDREYYDNIVAYWRPRAALSAGGEHRFAYVMRWGARPEPAMAVARVMQTRIGASPVRGKVVAIDFSPSDAIPGELSEITPQVSLGGGTLIHAEVRRHPETGGVRMGFSFDPEDATSIEIRAQLLVGTRRISEVWLYRWTV